MSQERVLIVDDEPQVRRVLRASLSSEGYEVWEAANGPEAQECVREFKPDLILLDLNMPGMSGPGISGLDVCQNVRLSHDVPIIVISARDSEQDKVALLDAGADDYLTKPFGTPELLARMRRLLARTRVKPEDTPNYRDDYLEIDFKARRVLKAGAGVRLTPKELDVLQFLVARSNVPVAHRELLRSVWGPEHGDEIAYLRVFINRLRVKIESDPAQPKYLLTEPWIGYRFAGTAEQP